MTKETLIEKTIKTISKLPQDQIQEVSDFADRILKEYEERILQKGMEKLVSASKTFNFLQEEELLYSVNDLKERYK